MDYSDTVKKVKSSIALVLIFKDNVIISQGSGFVFWKRGILVTCNHVVEDIHDKILIIFPDSKFIDAKIAIQDKEYDLALLKFDDGSREPLAKGDEKNVKEGIHVLISGYPLGISSLTTHQGILSAITKDATGVITYLIDGTVNVGNSGCPLMNKDGEVIGVVNATRREEATLLSDVQKMEAGAIAIHGVDLVKIYKALISNLQLGMGYAIPCTYIPRHQDPKIESGVN